MGKLSCKFIKTTEKMYTKRHLKNKWDALKSNWKLRNDLVGKETCRESLVPWESNGDLDEFTDQLKSDKGIENFEKLVDKRKAQICETVDKKVKKFKKVRLGRAKMGGAMKLSQ